MMETAFSRIIVLATIGLWVWIIRDWIRGWRR